MSVVSVAQNASWKTTLFGRYLDNHRDSARAVLVAGAVGVDVLAVGLAAISGGLVRFGGVSEANTLTLVAVIVPPYLLACVALDAYRLSVLKSASLAAARALYAVFIAVGCAASAALAFHAGAEFSRIESSMTLLGLAFYVMVSRPLGALILRRFDALIAPKVIVLADTVQPGEPLSDVQTIYLPVPDLTDHASLDSLFRAVRPVDRVVLRVTDPKERQHWVRVMQCLSVDAELVEPTLHHIVPRGVGEWHGAPTLIVSRGPLKLHERILKRGFDLGLVLLSLPILLPLLIILMLLVKIDSPGPAFFVQERLARRNRPYRCYKLRTMRHDVHDLTGSRSTARDDDRITRLGRFLRKSSIDELPQILNVLRGEMSLVGPRPHALGSRAGGALFWEVTPQYWGRHSIKPGLTGLAQVRGHRGATLTKQDIELRVAADLEYINRWSLWLDMRIIAETFLVLVHRNAF